MGRKVHYLYADLETTSVEIPKEYKSPLDYYNNCKNPIYPMIYSWGILWDSKYKEIGIKQNIKFKETTGIYNIEPDGYKKSKFIETISQINVDSVMYFNNLKGFDGHYLITELDKMGYKMIPPFDIDYIDQLPLNIQETYKERAIRIKKSLLKNSPTINSSYTNYKLESQRKADKYIAKQIERNWKLLQPNEYSLLTDSNANIYEIKIGLNSTKITGKTKKYRVLIIRDNLLLFPSSIKNMGETLNKKYNTTEYSKLDLSSNYLRYKRFKSLKEFENDGNELEYLLQDIYILFKFHKEIEWFLPRNEWKMTIGSSSYQQWQQTFGTQLLEEYISHGQVEQITIERGAIRYIFKEKMYSTNQLKKHLVSLYLPTKWLDKVYDAETNETFHNILYKYANGGITMVNEQYRGQFVEDITFIDINSSYPSVMSSDAFVPYGAGIKGDGGKKYPFKFYRITPLRNITNKKGFPFLHNEYASKREYLKTLKIGTSYRMTSIKYERFLKYYNPDPNSYKIEIECSFKQIPIKTFYKKFISYWYEIKQTTKDPVIKTLSKLFLNSLSGKNGTKSVREFKIWDAEDKEWYSGNRILESKYYLPLYIATIELGQCKLIDAIDDKYDQFVYCDTDSLAIKNFKPADFPTIEMHESKLGAWGVDFKGYGIFRRPKQYLLKNDHNKYKIAYAGINLDRNVLGDEDLAIHEQTLKHYENIKFKDFILGKFINNQIRNYKLIGYGVLLVDIEKEIKPVWNKHYGVLTEQKFFLPEHFDDTLKKLESVDK